MKDVVVIFGKIESSAGFDRPSRSPYSGSYKKKQRARSKKIVNRLLIYGRQGLIVLVLIYGLESVP